MEKEILGAKSPIFGRRTGQLHMKAFDYRTSADFLGDFTEEEKLELYGAFGGTALYLRQVQEGKNLEENIKELLGRMKSFKYIPQPVRRTYIPKPNGKMRPLVH